MHGAAEAPEEGAACCSSRPIDPSPRRENTMSDDPLEDMRKWADRAAKAQAAGAQAYARLLRQAEEGSSGQAARIARFIAATYNGTAFPLDLFELRAVDVDISDDMLLCLDALRWGKSDLYNLIPNGDERIRTMIKDWKLVPAGQ